MASLASRPGLVVRLRSLPLRSVVVPALILFGLLVVSVVLRTRALGESLWMDEGLSIGIASQPLFDIPSTLRVDGSPPLYYMLLSVWMSVIGNGPAETQGLSVAIALLAVPAGMWAGWTLFGRRAGYILAALCALNVFLTGYAQETRMYSLMLLLSLLVAAAFLHAFAFRDRRYLPVFAVLLAALLYTHNWGLFMAAGAVVALYPCWRALPEGDERRALLRDGLFGFGGAALLYLPWLPTLLHQVQHTGAPWLNPPRFGAPVQIAKNLLGGGTPSVSILLAGGAGIAAVLQRRLRGTDWAVGKGVPARAGSEQERTALIAAFVICVATLAIAWLVSQVSPAWTTRYLGVALGPILIIAAAGFARAGHLGLIGLVIVLGIWAIPKTYGLANKSNASDLAAAAAPQLSAGDLVISMQPEQEPLLNYHLEEIRGVKGLRYATPLGLQENNQVMDWTDAEEGLENANPALKLEPMLAKLPRSGRVLIVHPVTTDISDWDAPWTKLVRRRAAQWGGALAGDRRFKKVAVAPEFYRRATRIGIRAVLYEKTGT